MTPYDVMQEFHFLVVVFVGLVTMMRVIGVLRPQAEPWRHHCGDDVELTPWKYAKLGCVPLLAAGVTIYALLATFLVLK